MKPLRTLITPVVIAAVTIAGISAAPARAETSDLAKILLGIGAVAIIANASKKKKSSTTTTSSSYSTKNSTIITYPPNSRPRSHARKSYALPENCLYSYNAHRGTRELYSGTCLSRLPYRLADLPSSCAYLVQNRHGVRSKAFGPKCLARSGFYQVDSISDAVRGNRHIVWK